jgi:recombinational DNA repair ATPase RecF
MRDSHLAFTKYIFRLDYRDTDIATLLSPGYIESVLIESRDRDIASGHTHIGPHRDDISISVLSECEYLAPEYLSRGEMKMLLLSLKILEVGFIAGVRNLPIILLIDDIFAELDEANSRQFLSLIGLYQIILTTQRALLPDESGSDFTCINLASLYTLE